MSESLHGGQVVEIGSDMILKPVEFQVRFKNTVGLKNRFPVHERWDNRWSKGSLTKVIKLQPEDFPKNASPREGYMAGYVGLPLEEFGADDQGSSLHVLITLFLSPGLPEQVIDGFSPCFGNMKEKDFRMNSSL